MARWAATIVAVAPTLEAKSQLSLSLRFIVLLSFIAASIGERAKLCCESFIECDDHPGGGLDLLSRRRSRWLERPPQRIRQMVGLLLQAQVQFSGSRGSAAKNPKTVLVSG